MFGVLKKKKQGGGKNDTDAEFKEIDKPEVDGLLSELDKAIEAADDQITQRNAGTPVSKSYTATGYGKKPGGCGCWE